MVLTTVHALFDIVDKKTLQPATDADQRMKVFRHYFLDYNGIEPIPSGEKYIKLDATLPWEVRKEKTWHFTSSKVTRSKYIAVPVMSNEGEAITDSITIISNIVGEVKHFF